MPASSVLLQIKMPVFSSLLWIKVASFSLLKIKNASFICFVADKKKCQFYLHCCGSKLPVLFPLSQIKIASFILIFKDQNCKFYLKCHRPKLPALSILSQIKIASFNLNVRDQNCQLFIVEDRNASFICVVADKKLPVSSLSQIKIASFLLLKIKNASIILLFQIKNASFLFNVTDQDCQLYLYCHRWKISDLSALLGNKIASSIFFIKIASFIIWAYICQFLAEKCQLSAKIDNYKLKIAKFELYLAIPGQNVPIVCQK